MPSLLSTCYQWHLFKYFLGHQWGQKRAKFFQNFLKLKYRKWVSDNSTSQFCFISLIGNFIINRDLEQSRSLWIIRWIWPRSLKIIALLGVAKIKKTTYITQFSPWVSFLLTQGCFSLAPRVSYSTFTWYMV